MQVSCSKLYELLNISLFPGPQLAQHIKYQTSPILFYALTQVSYTIADLHLLILWHIGAIFHCDSQP